MLHNIFCLFYVADKFFSLSAEFLVTLAFLLLYYYSVYASFILSFSYKCVITFMKDTENNNQSTVFGQIDVDGKRFEIAPSVDDLPILATRNLVLFPGVTIPISLGRESSIITASEAAERPVPIGIVCQINPEEDKPAVTTGLYKYGVIADVLKVFDLPDGSKTALVRSRGKFRIIGRGSGETIPGGGLSARVKLIPEIVPDELPAEDGILVEQVRESAVNIVNKTAENSKEIVFAINQTSTPYELINFLCTNMQLEAAEKVALLARPTLHERAYALLEALLKNEEKVDITRDILQRTRQNMDQNQRNAFLQQQMETIREELYGENDDADELVRRAENVDMPEKVRTIFNKEIEKLRRLNPQSPDFSVQFTYLDTLLELPWNKETDLNTDFSSAREILENDHYGLEKVKERILEQLAVLMHNPEGKAPIICLVGPPGVGKTSLGESVARALGRKYQRVSLGGVHDESEIRGHRRTYIGAMPGRIINALRRAKASNPVLLLDEIDKLGADFKGDPSSALLEVLDPEQNKFFHDNYIDIDYDLSHALFIATANTLSSLQQPLLDRMEIIDLSGYLLEEKVEIARRYLLPRIEKEMNIESGQLVLSDEALVKLIETYTSESGVRQLEKRLAALARKLVLAQMTDATFPATIQPEHLRDLLGLPPFSKEHYEGNDFAGVVTGLAWTQVGGEILLAEASLSPGKGEKLTITGNLGDVMKESAAIALQWVKAHAGELDIDPEMFEKNNLHIHFPEGAIPKDGPSAGITIATAIVSAFTRRRVAPRIAMTGEITLRGKVLPVGGIKEKILAAKRAGITDIVLSAENRKDIEDIAERYISGLTFHYVTTVDEVIAIALTEEHI